MPRIISQRHRCPFIKRESDYNHIAQSFGCARSQHLCPQPSLIYNQCEAHTMHWSPDSFASGNGPLLMSVQISRVDLRMQHCVRNEGKREHIRQATYHWMTNMTWTFLKKKSHLSFLSILWRWSRCQIEEIKAYCASPVWVICIWVPLKPIRCHITWLITLCYFLHGTQFGHNCSSNKLPQF